MKYEHVEETYKYFNELPVGDYYEFGLHTGNTASRFLKGFIENRVPVRKCFLFDSMIGLPKEADHVWHNPEWPEGAFNTLKELNVNNEEEALEILYEKLDPYGIPYYIIIAWFDQLDRKVVEQTDMGLASVVHIDCDIYISSKQALNFLFANKLVQTGTFFRFDDICSTPQYAGQHLALIEIQKEYKVELQQLSANCFSIINYRFEN